MLNEPTNAAYRCRMASKGTAWAATILCSICVFLIVVVLLSFDANPIIAVAALSPVLVFVFVVAVKLVIETATVFTITDDSVVLSQFGRQITSFPLDSISLAGVFVRYNNRSPYIFISSINLEGLSERKNGKEINKLLFDSIKSTANKKNSKVICFEQTKERNDTIQKLIPQFSLENVVRL